MAENPRRLLERYGLHPRRSLGQNFLVAPHAPEKIALGAEIGPEDTVLEVGAGVGTLTEALAARAGHVIAVETDGQLLDVLRDLFGASSNVELVHGDILKLDPATLLKTATPAASLPLWGARLEHYLVVANLPYYITAAVLRHLLEASVRPARLIVTVQREVAERMVAAPGNMSLLGVSIQFYGKPQILFSLKRGSFHPAPAVDSAVVRVDLYATPPVGDCDVAQFFRVVSAGFAQRRKQLHNSLAATLDLPSAAVSAALSAAAIDPTIRAEELSIQAWGQVSRALLPLLPSAPCNLITPPLY